MGRVNAGNTLTLGAAATDIDLGSATADLTLNCALTLGAANVWNVATNRTLTVGGVVAGAFPVTKSDNGTAVLTGANTYSGPTTLSAGILSVSATNNLGAPSAGLLLDGGTLRVTGTTMTNVGHALSFTADKNVTLEVGDAGNSFIVDQALTQGTGRFIKQGPGMATLTGADTYTGNLIVRQGTLNLWGAKTGAVGGMTVADTAGLNATLNLTNGLYAVAAGGEFSVGNATTTAATGTVNQSGGQVTFGASGNQLLIGRQANVGNIGNYNLSGGSITIPLSSQANRGVDARGEPWRQRELHVERHRRVEPDHRLGRLW
jgi:autotransporter-associated beta strand protein